MYYEKKSTYCEEPVEGIAHLNHDEDGQRHRHWLSVQEHWTVDSSKQRLNSRTLHVMCLKSNQSEAHCLKYHKITGYCF